MKFYWDTGMVVHDAMSSATLSQYDDVFTFSLFRTKFARPLLI